VPTEETRETNVIDLTVAQHDEPVVEPALEGDDITVTNETVAEPRRRSFRRAWLIALGVGAVVLMIAIVAFVVTSNDDAGDERVATDTGNESAVDSPSTSAVTLPGAGTTQPVQAPSDSSPSASAPIVAPPSGPAATPPSAATPPAAPGTTVPAPLTSPVSVLQWSATPAAITVRSGEVTTVSITVRNPSNGVVTLPNPMSCTPALDGSAMCAQMAEMVAPGSQHAQIYNIDARGIAPGSYSFVLQGGLFSVPVTVTPAA
jgi:hypothetical protein